MGLKLLHSFSGDPADLADRREAVILRQKPPGASCVGCSYAKNLCARQSRLPHRQPVVTRRGRPLRWRAAACSLWLVLPLIQPSAQADPLAATIGTELGYTNNVNLTRVKEADVPFEVFLGLDYQGRSSRIEGALNGRVGYRDYLQNKAEDELVPSLHGNLLFHLKPDRLSWAFSGDWRQSRINRTGPNSAANLQNELILWTGPDFTSILSATTDLTAKARVGYSYNSGSSGTQAPDDLRFGGELALNLRRSRFESLSTNVAVREVRYLNGGSGSATTSDFRIADVFVGYHAQREKRALDLALGASVGTSDDGADRSVPLVRTEASAPLGLHSRSGLRLTLGLEDQANAALTPSLLPNSNNPVESKSVGFYYNQRLEAYYSHDAKRANLIARIYGEDRDYQGKTDDESSYGAELSWGLRLSRATDGQAYGRFEYTDFQGIATRTQLYTAGLQVSRKLGRNLSANSEIRYQAKTSNNPALEYDETALMLSLGYAFRL